MENKKIKFIIIFTSPVSSSGKEGLYINLFGHYVNNLKNQGFILDGKVNIKFISIITDESHKSTELRRLENLRNSIFDKINNMYYDKSIGEDSNYKYKIILDDIKYKFMINFECVNYDRMLYEIPKEYFEFGIFDVSGLKKDFLTDVLFVLLKKNCYDLFVFEIINRDRKFDDRDLIHNLVYKHTYEYENVIKNKYIQEFLASNRKGGFKKGYYFLRDSLILIQLFVVGISLPYFFGDDLVSYVVGILLPILGFFFPITRWLKERNL